MSIEMLFNIALVLWYIIFAIVFIQIYFRFYREYSHKYKERYLNHMPKPLNPLVLCMLLYHNVDVVGMISTVYFLIFKEYLKIKIENNEKYIVKGNDDSSLSSSQKCVAYLLINVIGDGEKVRIKDIEKYCNSRNNMQEFKFSHQMWKRYSVKEGSSCSFYESKMCYPRVKFVWVSSVVIMLTNLIFGFGIFMGYASLVLGLILLMMFLSADKRTMEATNDYYEWQAFKNYLNDNDDFGCDDDTKKKFLIYGTILKVPKITEKLDFHGHEVMKDIEHALNKCLKRCKLGE